MLTLHRSVWMIFKAGMPSLILLSLLAVGCQPAPSATAHSLPWHSLDWSRQTSPSNKAATARSARANSAQTASGDGNWAAVSGHRQWRYIVIHHSASEGGNASQFDADHKRRGWDELGYHFVISNGNGGPDGRVEIGPRWRSQKWGAHTGKTPNNQYNNYGIGICMVGNFSNRLPSGTQLASLHRLVSYLANKYQIPPENVIGHRDAPGTSTECPGDSLHRYLRTNLRPSLSHYSIK